MSENQQYIVASLASVLKKRKALTINEAIEILQEEGVVKEITYERMYAAATYGFTHGSFTMYFDGNTVMLGVNES